jgi:hypothetical protein
MTLFFRKSRVLRHHNRFLTFIQFFTGQTRAQIEHLLCFILHGTPGGLCNSQNRPDWSALGS